MAHRHFSLTGTYERQTQAYAQMVDGDLVSALINRRYILRIREYHVLIPPYSSLRDVENAHNDIADVLDAILLQLNNSDETLVNRYTAEAANHRHLGGN